MKNAGCGRHPGDTSHKAPPPRPPLLASAANTGHAATGNPRAPVAKKRTRWRKFGAFLLGPTRPSPHPARHAPGSRNSPLQPQILPPQCGLNPDTAPAQTVASQPLPYKSPSLEAEGSVPIFRMSINSLSVTGAYGSSHRHIGEFSSTPRLPLHDVVKLLQRTGAATREGAPHAANAGDAQPALPHAATSPPTLVPALGAHNSGDSGLVAAHTAQPTASSAMQTVQQPVCIIGFALPKQVDRPALECWHWHQHAVCDQLPAAHGWPASQPFTARQRHAAPPRVSCHPGSTNTAAGCEKGAGDGAWPSLTLNPPAAMLSSGQGVVAGPCPISPSYQAGQGAARVGAMGARAVAVPPRHTLAC
ncbi:hypothetical protein HaLaN_20246, partial [Haematococcus lacustris]